MGKKVKNKDLAARLGLSGTLVFTGVKTIRLISMDTKGYPGIESLRLQGRWVILINRRKKQEPAPGRRKTGGSWYDSSYYQRSFF
jgi:hypothetical protein